MSENGYTANLICSPMEADMDIPKDYFDYIYSIYGIGWTTDLDGTFKNLIVSEKKDGIFILVGIIRSITASHGPVMNGKM